MKARVEYVSATKRKKCHNPIALAHRPFPIAHQLRFVSLYLSLSLSCPLGILLLAQMHNAAGEKGAKKKKQIEKCLCQESIILAIFVESLHGHTYES